MNVLPSFRYRFADFLRGSAVFLSIYILITAGIAVSCLTVVNGTVGFSGYEISTCITVFVFGIVNAREDLRLGIQNGISRRSVFYGTLFAAVLVTLLLAAVGEVLTTAMQALTAGTACMEVSGLYQMLFAADTDWISAPFGLHFASAVFIFSLLIGANLAGRFISLMFFRLNKLWTVIVAVGAPIFLFWILPLMLARSGIDFGAFFKALLFTPTRVSAFFLILAAVAAAADRLLMLRAPIRPAAR